MNNAKGNKKEWAQIHSICIRNNYQKGSVGCKAVSDTPTVTKAKSDEQTEHVSSLVIS